MKCQNLDLIIDLVDENDIKEFKIANEIAYNIRVCQNFKKQFLYHWICKLYSLKKAKIQLTLNSRNIKESMINLKQTGYGYYGK